MVVRCNLRFYLIGFSVLANLVLPRLALAVSEADFQSEYDSKVLPYFDGATVNSEFSGQAGISIHYRAFEKPNERAALVLLPGKGESTQKYAELIYDLRNEGLSIYVMDHRGQGQSGRLTSDPQVTHLDKYRYWIDDLSSFIDHVVLSKPHKKIFMLAHSMGGAIAAGYLITHPGVIDAAVLSSPMLQINTSPYSEAIALLIADLGRAFGQGKNYALGQKPFDPNETIDTGMMTHSQVRFDAYHKILLENPSLRVGGVSYQWVQQSLRFGLKIRKHASSVSTPVLLLQDGEDVLVVPGAQDKFCAEAKACKKITFPESRHEILMEVDAVRDRALTAIRGFFADDQP